MTPRVMVYIAGGMVTTVIADVDVRVVVIDEDTDYMTEEETMRLDLDGTDEIGRYYVNYERRAEVNVNAMDHLFKQLEERFEIS